MTSWFRDGPSDPVAREAGALHDAYFNHQPMLMEEVNYFVREFEETRGDLDLQATRNLLKQMEAAGALLQEATDVCAANLDGACEAVEVVNEIATAELPKEAARVDALKLHTRKLVLDATAEREKYIAEMERFQKEVDDNFEERKKAFEEKYYVSPEVMARLEAQRTRDLESSRQGGSWFL